jgi:7,8-dihydropterin-6-yl-methyl-4-(beta-D-ribofuranosyl)aminobenzene 5'-phosphate synthase
MKLTCLVDNTVGPRSRFWGEHGVAFLVESEDGQILFDTGASGVVLLHNMEAADVVPESIAALALSHAHDDHTGGLPAFLERRSGLPIYAHPGILRQRFSRRGGQMQSIGLPLGAEALGRLADLRLSDMPQEMLPGVWTTGEIFERNDPEGRSAHHFVREGEAWIPDLYQDDMSLILEGAEGLVLVCGCCHAGLLNTLAHVRQHFGRNPVVVAGGTHLLNADEAHLRRLVDVLRRLGPPDVYPNHCTGQMAYVVLAQALGDRVAPCLAGTVLEF